MIVDMTSYLNKKKSRNAKLLAEKERLLIEKQALAKERYIMLKNSNNRFNVFTDEELKMFEESGLSQIAIEDVATPISERAKEIDRRLIDIEITLRGGEFNNDN